MRRVLGPVNMSAGPAMHEEASTEPCKEVQLGAAWCIVQASDQDLLGQCSDHAGRLVIPPNSMQSECMLDDERSSPLIFEQLHTNIVTNRTPIL